MSNLLLTNSFLFSTGLMAGALNGIAGGGGFITFPALLLTGINPIIANATNNTALFIGYLGGIKVYSKEYSFTPDKLKIIFFSMLGSCIGSMTVLYISPSSFKSLIPWLLLLSTIIFSFSKQINKVISNIEKNILSPESLNKFLVFLQILVGIYGGFYGGGQGVLILSLLSLLGFKNIFKINAYKILLCACINGIAVIIFWFSNVIVWEPTLIMAVGTVLGNYLIASYGSKFDPNYVRKFIISISSIITAISFFKSF